MTARMTSKVLAEVTMCPKKYTIYNFQALRQITQTNIPNVNNKVKFIQGGIQSPEL